MRRNSQILYGFFFLMLTLWFCGCFGTPQPLPPNVEPQIFEENLFAKGQNTNGPIPISGRAGAVSPPESALRIFNLDNEEPPTTVSIDQDGSFYAEIRGAYGDEFRLEALLRGSRSSPVDIIVHRDEILPAPRPLSHCFRTVPEFLVEVPREQISTIQLINECSEPVVVESAGLRSPSAPFSFDTDVGTIAPNEREQIDIRFLGGWGGNEDILFLMVTEPVETRIPITLSVTSVE